MIEAMACGTPVVAWSGGSVDEVITDGLTGFVVESLDQAVAATHDAVRLDRVACRQEFERRFTVERMATDYLAVYGDLAGGRSARHRVKADAGQVA
jgi:glycosyltransferase involved in cell wall biosynthesis